LPGGAFVSSAGNQIKNLLGKSNHNTSREGQEAVGSLAGIVALEGQTDLHDAEAKHDDANGSDKTENEVGQIVYNLDRVVGGVNGHHADGTEQNSRDKDREKFLAFVGKVLHRYIIPFRDNLGCGVR